MICINFTERACVLVTSLWLSKVTESKIPKKYMMQLGKVRKLKWKSFEVHRLFKLMLNLKLLVDFDPMCAELTFLLLRRCLD